MLRFNSSDLKNSVVSFKTATGLAIVAI